MCKRMVVIENIFSEKFVDDLKKFKDQVKLLLRTGCSDTVP